ncbi:MAG: hypothetical protein A2Z97_02880 [Bdellovibrionales bacterium GWB1_52_6]|nr:MAG: hypothetical protein A2Z97_02880 [Bdellovibrionales bacterium GWB1_52_6]OFZ03551.1 MAG: hypothetical protein A2X97_05825 [Bdellovibrionales bacterium GWA1_52_35]
MKSLLRLKPYLRPYIWFIAISAILAIPLAALRLGPAPLAKYLVNDVLVEHNSWMLTRLAIGVVLLYTANFVVRFFHFYLLRVVVARVNQKIKNDLYEHLLGLSADYFTAQSTGTLISRVGVDPTYVDAAIMSINTLVREPITFLLLFGYAMSLNWRLTVLMFIVFPPLAWVFSTTGRNLKRYIGKLSEESAHLYSVIQESFSGVRVVKTFRLEEYVRRKFYDRSNYYTHVMLKIAAMEEAAHPMVELITSFILGLMIYYGGRQVLSGEMSSGDLIAFFAAFALMINPLRVLNEVNIRLNQAAGACDRIFQIFDWKSNIPDPVSPVPLSGFHQGIEVRQISFAYPDAPQRLILKDVSFDLKIGKTVALVGASGAGKSSMVSLFPRIFDVTAGGIFLDGQNIRNVSLGDLRKIFAVVSQDVFLFNDTVEENIRCGRLGATPEEIREAARRAHALDFIEGLPDGFSTIIGDRGQKLSGGERQRLSIARAFLREAPVLILDEATSSLDTASERAVQSALDELMLNRTTLIIAHRLSTVKHADLILVMKDGEVVERGTHDELLQKSGEYAKFHHV